MKKVVLVSMLIFVASCVLDAPLDDGEIGGTKGVEVNFMTGHPDSRIYENNPVEAVIQLRNRGSYDEPYGKVVLHGYDPSVISFEGQFSGLNYVEKNLPKLRARSKYLPEGGYDNVRFEAVASNVKVDGGEKYSTNLFATACYHYLTTSSPSICVVPAGALPSDRSCTPKTITMSSQGAPVAVTEVKSQVISDRMDVVVTLEHKGSGRLVSPREESYDNCPLNLRERDLGEVLVDISIDGLPSPDCEDNLISLYRDVGRAHCTFDLENIDAGGYTTQINIEASYLYTDRTKRAIEIINLGS